MILVDTSVWIDLFIGRTARHVTVLEKLILDRQDICVCGLILTEVLQGIRKKKDYLKTKALFDDLLFLPMTKSTFVKAAEIYRGLRRKGLTIRKPIDCMIASTAIEHEVLLLHNDKDFAPIEKHYDLKSLKLR